MAWCSLEGARFLWRSWQAGILLHGKGPDVVGYNVQIAVDADLAPGRFIPRRHPQQQSGSNGKRGIRIGCCGVGSDFAGFNNPQAG